MPSAEQDLKYLSGAVEELEPFLLSKEIYWPIAGPLGPASSRLSMGGLLLARVRAHFWPLTPAQRQAFEVLDSQIEAARQAWQTHWAEKATREYPARLALWKGYLSDYLEDRNKYARDYPQRAQWHAMLDLLAAEAGTITPSVHSQEQVADRQLKAVFEPGVFIWESPLEAAFPPTPYWYLYGKLK